MAERLTDRTTNCIGAETGVILGRRPEMYLACHMANNSMGARSSYLAIQPEYEQ
jgi:hypothetical protein